MRSFLPYSVAATLGVLAFPSSVLFSMLLLTEPNPPVLLCSAISIALSSLASVVGARLWQKHARSNEISFGDLMIWSWWTRRRAEARLSRGTAALGLDRRGTPVSEQQLSREDQLRVLHELNEALESKDPYTRGHSKRVERHVFRMANTMGLSVHDIEDLRLAASLHDVGKIRVPDHILRKPGKLTPEEYRIMQDHPSVGAWMLSYVGNQDVIEAVRYHHERWDGRGYPDGLSGTDIPLFARMIAVADTFDAITSTRPYRAKSARDEGLKELKRAAGSQLDPMCVDVFTTSLPDPVPVAALLFLLPFGIKKLVRELGVVARRAGVQTIATGVSAASAAVIVTTPVVAPSLGAPPRVERAVDSGSEQGAPQDLADDGNASALAADDESTSDTDAQSSGEDSGFERDDEEAGDVFGRVQDEDDPLTSIPATINDPEAAVPPSDQDGSSDPGSSGSDAGSSDNSGSGGDPSSSDDGGTSGTDKGKDKDESGNRGSGGGSGSDGNPGASAGQHGTGPSDDKDKDKDKGKDKGEESPAPPGNSDGSGSGNSGGTDNGNSGDNGNGNGNGPPEDHGNSGGSGNGNSGDNGNSGGSGNGNSGDNGNGNPGGDKEKDKEKGGGEDPGATGSE